MYGRWGLRIEARYIDALPGLRVVEQDLPRANDRVGRQYAHDGLRRNRLAGTRFADQRHGFTWIDAKGNVHQRRHGTVMQREIDRQFLDFQQGSILSTVCDGKLLEWLALSGPFFAIISYFKAGYLTDFTASRQRIEQASNLAIIIQVPARKLFEPLLQRSRR